MPDHDVSRAHKENLLQRLEEAERELEGLGAAYFEAHCGPHLGRLQENRGDSGPPEPATTDYAAANAAAHGLN